MVRGPALMGAIAGAAFASLPGSLWLTLLGAAGGRGAPVADAAGVLRLGWKSHRDGAGPGAVRRRAGGAPGRAFAGRSGRGAPDGRLRRSAGGRAAPLLETGALDRGRAPAGAGRAGALGTFALAARTPVDPRLCASARAADLRRAGRSRQRRHRARGGVAPVETAVPAGAAGRAAGRRAGRASLAAACRR